MGAGLSNPVTTLGIERKGNGFVRAAAVSMQGWRTDMEDEHNIELSLNDEHGISLFGVYDGHGGAKASQFIRAKLPSLLSASVANLAAADIKKTIEEVIVHQLDAQFLADGKEDGSTCCFVLTQPWDIKRDKPHADGAHTDLSGDTSNIAFKILAVNVGDSRAMIIRKDGTWISLTRDHKPTDDAEKKRIISAGGSVNNQRVDGNLALSRAIGDATFKRNPNLPVTAQKVISVPEFTEEMIYPGDTLLVACDGLYETGEMTWEHVAELAYSSISSLRVWKPDVWDPAVVSRNLIEQSLVYESRDNHTVIVAQFSDGTDFINDIRPATEVVPGKYHVEDESFVNAYRSDLARYGLTTKQIDDVIAHKEYHNNANTRNSDVIQMIEVKEYQSSPTSGFPPELMSQFINLLQSNSD